MTIENIANEIDWKRVETIALILRMDDEIKHITLRYLGGQLPTIKKEILFNNYNINDFLRPHKIKIEGIGKTKDYTSYRVDKSSSNLLNIVPYPHITIRAPKGMAKNSWQACYLNPEYQEFKKPIKKFAYLAIMYYGNNIAYSTM